MQARYTILNVMREAGIVKLVNTDKVDAAAVDKAKELLAAKAAAAEAGAGGAGAGAGAADDAPAAKDDGAAELGVCVQLDRSKIATDGVKAVGDFLRKLQVFKVLVFSACWPVATHCSHALPSPSLPRPPPTLRVPRQCTTTTVPCLTSCCLCETSSWPTASPALSLCR